MSILAAVVPTCPADCGSVLPDTLFNACNPSVGFGEIQSIFIGIATADPFDDWTDLAQWEAALALATTETNALRELVVSGDLPLPAADEIVISKGRKVYSPATRTINFDIDDISAENYEFARTTSCNIQFRIWFMTPSWMYGGNDGVLAMVHFEPVIERGIKSLNKFTGTVTWDAQFPPERAASVYAS
jgi:hypothetical protein